MRLTLFFLLSIFSAGLSAQAFLKSEYIGSSKYYDENNEATGGKGDALIFSAGIQIPLSMKMNENHRPTFWGIGLGGSYTSFNNKNISKDMCASEIMNAQISLTHMRPIRKNMSILASLGVGSYTTHTDISKIGMRNILGHGGVIFIWHLRDNLAIGVGPVINTSFGYPMAFPGFYLNWELNGRFEVKASMLNAAEISAGINMNKHFKLSLGADMSGSVALEKRDGKNMMFSHQYITTGLKPEFKFGKIKIPITIGISAVRPAFYQESSLKAFFDAMSREYDPYFRISLYGSVGIIYGF